MRTLTTTPYAGPVSLDGALRARADHPDWLILAGGTDVMVPRAEETFVRDVKGVLDVFGVHELHGVTEGRGVVRVGAATTYAELLDSDALRDSLPLLASAAREVGAVQIRERGTIGGNVMTASPVGDMLPGLLALDARVVLASVGGTRSVPYERFLAGYRLVDLRSDELLVAIDIPIPDPGTTQHWRKVGARAAQAISKVSLAATARLASGRVAACRLAFGGVADRPIRLHAVEAQIVGEAPGPPLADAVAAAVRASLHPITDVRSTEDYRRDVAGRLARRFVAGLT